MTGGVTAGDDGGAAGGLDEGVGLLPGFSAAARMRVDISTSDIESIPQGNCLNRIYWQ